MGRLNNPFEQAEEEEEPPRPQPRAKPKPRGKLNRSAFEEEGAEDTAPAPQGRAQGGPRPGRSTPLGSGATPPQGPAEPGPGPTPAPQERVAEQAGSVQLLHRDVPDADTPPAREALHLPEGAAAPQPGPATPPALAMHGSRPSTPASAASLAASVGREAGRGSAAATPVVAPSSVRQSPAEVGPPPPDPAPADAVPPPAPEPEPEQAVPRSPAAVSEDAAAVPATLPATSSAALLSLRGVLAGLPAEAGGGSGVASAVPPSPPPQQQQQGQQHVVVEIRVPQEHGRRQSSLSGGDAFGSLQQHQLLQAQRSPASPPFAGNVAAAPWEVGAGDSYSPQPPSYGQQMHHPQPVHHMGFVPVAQPHAAGPPMGGGVGAGVPVHHHAAAQPRYVAPPVPLPSYGTDQLLPSLQEISNSMDALKESMSPAPQRREGSSSGGRGGEAAPPAVAAPPALPPPLPEEVKSTLGQILQSLSSINTSVLSSLQAPDAAQADLTPLEAAGALPLRSLPPAKRDSAAPHSRAAPEASIRAPQLPWGQPENELRLAREIQALKDMHREAEVQAVVDALSLEVEVLRQQQEEHDAMAGELTELQSLQQAVFQQHLQKQQATEAKQTLIDEQQRAYLAKLIEYQRTLHGALQRGGIALKPFPPEEPAQQTPQQIPMSHRDTPSPRRRKAPSSQKSGITAHRSQRSERDGRCSVPPTPASQDLSRATASETDADADESVAEVLRGLKLERYTAAFARQQITLPVMHTLTEAELERIGVAALGPRKVLLKWQVDQAQRGVGGGGGGGGQAQSVRETIATIRELQAVQQDLLKQQLELSEKQSGLPQGGAGGVRRSSGQSSQQQQPQRRRQPTMEELEAQMAEATRKQGQRQQAVAQQQLAQQQQQQQQQWLDQQRAVHSPPGTRQPPGLVLGRSMLAGAPPPPPPPMVQARPTWSVYLDTKSNRPYYVNNITKATQWEEPRDVQSIVVKGIGGVV